MASTCPDSQPQENFCEKPHSRDNNLLSKLKMPFFSMKNSILNVFTSSGASDPENHRYFKSAVQPR